MHFPIIELTSKKQDACDWMDEFTLCDDSLVEWRTDYVQDVTPEEREEWLKFLPSFFEGIADVDLEKHEVRFKSNEEIERTLDDYYYEIVDKMANTETKGWQRFFDIRCYGELFRDADAMFYYNGSSYTSMQFIEECCYCAGETLYIGGVVDAHV